MKKSERYHMAMKAVLRAGFPEEATIEIMDTLMSEMNLAKWAENDDRTKEAAE